MKCGITPGEAAVVNTSSASTSLTAACRFSMSFSKASILPSDGAGARGGLGGHSSRAAGGVLREVIGFAGRGGSGTFTLKAGQAVFHVSGVTGFALLAVIEDGETDLGLLAHHR